MSPRDGLGWAGLWKGPCLFWEVFRTLRFWKSTVAVHDCSQLWEEERMGARFLGFSGQGEAQD